MNHRGAAILLQVIALSACSAAPHHAPAARAQPGATAATRQSPDPRTAAALTRIAQAFNNNYDTNHDGPVWDRWDARSQAIITRAEYIRRHAECATAPQGPAHVESATPGPHGAWLVGYEIGGQQLTDYWYYIHRRWEFDLLLSNPGGARLYRQRTTTSSQPPVAAAPARSPCRRFSQEQIKRRPVLGSLINEYERAA
jgi:hypothetical protein